MTLLSLLCLINLVNLDFELACKFMIFIVNLQVDPSNFQQNHLFSRVFMECSLQFSLNRARFLVVD